MLEAAAPDAFAAFNKTYVQARLWRRFAWALMVLIALQTFALVVLAVQPPWVVRPEGLHTGALEDGEAPRIARLGDDPRTQVADARLFFGHMLRLRYGWQSSSVMHDLAAFLQQCHPEHRSQQLAHLQGSPEGLDAAAETGAAAAPTRLTQWLAARVVNQVIFPEHLQDLRCNPRDNAPVWDCTMRGAVVTRPEKGAAAAGTLAALGSGAAPARTGAVAKKGLFVATLMEVPHSLKTPYGLLLAHLDVLPDPTEDTGNVLSRPAPPAQAEADPASGQPVKQGDVSG